MPDEYTPGATRIRRNRGLYGSSGTDGGRVKACEGDGPARGEKARGTDVRQKQLAPRGLRKGPPREGRLGGVGVAEETVAGGTGGWTKASQRVTKGTRPRGKAPTREAPLPRCRADRAAARRGACRKDRIAEQDETTSTPPSGYRAHQSHVWGTRSRAKESRGTRPRPGKRRASSCRVPVTACRLSLLGLSVQRARTSPRCGRRRIRAPVPLWPPQRQPLQIS